MTTKASDRTIIGTLQADRIRKSGLMIGILAKSKSDPDFGWEVYLYNGSLIACCIDADKCVSHGKQITPNDLVHYCDDPSVARWVLENGADIRTHPTCTAGGPDYLAHLARAE